jgi:hypothetical protein
VVGEHVDQRALAYIGSADKGKLGFIRRWTFGVVRVAGKKDRFFDHGKECLAQR